MRISRRSFALILTICSLALACRADDTQTFGIARDARLTGNFEDALKLYEKIQEGSLAEPARCYEADCLARLGKFDEAVAAYEKFLAVSEFQTYRGEALLELSRLQCSRSASPDVLTSAKGRLVDAIVWHDIVRADAPSDTPGDGAAPSPVPALVDGRANLNVHTCPWYLPALKAETLRLLLYVHISLGETDAGHKVLDQLTAAERDIPTMLRISTNGLRQDVAKGSFILPPGIWQSITTTHQAQARLAFFYLATGGHRIAAPLLYAVHAQTAEGAGHADDWAAAEIGLALCEHHLGERSSAIKRLGLFENVLRGTTASRFGRLLLANQLAVDAKSYNQSVRLYGDLVNEPGKSPTPAEALLAMVIASANHADAGTCYRAADQLRSKFPESQESRLAQAVLNAMSPSNTSGKDARPARRRVNAVTDDAPATEAFSHHLVLPSSSVLNLINPQAADLIVIELSTESLTQDADVTNANIIVSPATPQPPNTRNRRIYVLSTEK